METIGKDDYILVRNMLCGNTFGQDGDIHDDILSNYEKSHWSIIY